MTSARLPMPTLRVFVTILLLRVRSKNLVKEGMSMKRISYLVAIFFTILPSVSKADIVSVNPRPRMEAMGGAGVAAMGDHDSAMMNPAGLADVEKTKLDIL